MLETALSELVNTVLKSISRYNTSDVLWDRYECIELWGQKVTFQGHVEITCWNHHCTGGGIQYSTSRVELDFLVAYCSYFTRWRHCMR